MTTRDDRLDDGDRAQTALRAARAGASVAGERFRSELAVETKTSKTDLVTDADRAAQRAVRDVIAASAPGEAFVGEEGGPDAAEGSDDGHLPGAEESDDGSPTDVEERGDVPSNGPAWIVDPIDGTANFVRGLALFGTAVAAVRDGEPVAAAVEFPALNDCYRSGPDGAVLNDDPLAVSDRSDPVTCAVCPTLWWPHDRRDEYAGLTEAIVTRFGDLRRVGCAQAELAMVASGALDATITTVQAKPWDTVAGVHLVREAGGRVTDLEGDRWRHDSQGLVASNGLIHGEALAAAREAASGVEE